MTMVPPLQGVVAFFDLVENHDSLIAQIRELGAEVDDFFSVDRITLLVTNKKPPTAKLATEGSLARASSTRDGQSQAATTHSKSGTEDSDSTNSGRNNRSGPGSSSKVPSHPSATVGNNSHGSAAAVKAENPERPLCSGELTCSVWVMAGQASGNPGAGQ